MEPLSPRRYQALRERPLDLARLPFAVPTEEGWLTQQGEDLILLSDTQGQAFRRQEATPPGVRGWFGRTEPTLFATDGETTLAFNPKGESRPADYPDPGALPTARLRLQEAQKLLDESRNDPLKRTLVDLPFGSLEAARATLAATAPVTTGSAAWVSLAQASAMIGGSGRLAPSVAETLRPVLVCELEPDYPALAKALHSTKKPQALIPSLAQLPPELGPEALKVAANTPAASELVPLMLAQLEEQPPLLALAEALGLSTPEVQVQLATGLEAPLEAAGRLARQVRDPEVRANFLAGALSLEAERATGTRKHLLKAIADMPTQVEKLIGQPLDGPLPTALAALAFVVPRSEQSAVVERLTRDLEGPEAELCRRLAALPHRGQYASPGKTLHALGQRAESPWIEAGLAALGCVDSAQQVAAMEAILDTAPDEPELVELLRTPLRLGYRGQYESLYKTENAMFAAYRKAQGGPVPPAEAALLSGLGTLARPDQGRLLKTAVDLVHPDLRGVLRNLADVDLTGQYESYYRTVHSLVKGYHQDGKRGAELLLGAMGTVSGSRQNAVLRCALPGLPHAEMLERMSTMSFGGQYESLYKAFAAGLKKESGSSMDPLVAFTCGAALASQDRSCRALLKHLGAVAPDKPIAQFLGRLAAIKHPAQYESLHKTLSRVSSHLEENPTADLVDLAEAACVVVGADTRVDIVEMTMDLLSRDLEDPTAQLFAPAPPSRADIAADPVGCLRAWRSGWTRYAGNIPDVERGIMVEEDQILVGEHGLAIRQL